MIKLDKYDYNLVFLRFFKESKLDGAHWFWGGSVWQKTDNNNDIDSDYNSTLLNKGNFMSVIGIHQETFSLYNPRYNKRFMLSFNALEQIGNKQ